MAAEQNTTSEDSGLLFKLYQEIITSPLNICLVCVIAILIYKIFKGRQASTAIHEPVVPDLPKLKKKDYTIEELKKYDGTGSDGRILIAVNGKVFDVTKGTKFYGPGGPYATFAGTDASRGLATFSVTGGKEEYDDLSDLNSVEMDSVREWEMQFTDRYDYVGNLLKPGQKPTSYSDDEEEEASQQEASEKSKDD